MFLLRWLAVALLALPSLDGGKTPEPGALYRDVLPALRTAAVRGELLDPKELRYVLADPHVLAADLALLARRSADLADAPPLSDCARFPDGAAIDDRIAFNRQYRQFLDKRLSTEPLHRAELQAAGEEADRLYVVWDLIRMSQSDCYRVPERRRALRRVRELLGAEAYYGGCLPPHVPVWRFRLQD
jgi:hypothetical protein